MASAYDIVYSFCPIAPCPCPTDPIHSFLSQSPHCLHSAAQFPCFHSLQLQIQEIKIPHKLDRIRSGITGSICFPQGSLLGHTQLWVASAYLAQKTPLSSSPCLFLPTSLKGGQESSGLNLGKKISVPRDVMLEELSLLTNRGSKMFKLRQMRVEKFIYENHPDVFSDSSMVSSGLYHPQSLVLLRTTS